MCGIGGILMFPKERTESELKYIRDLADFIMIENEVRGDDAAGIAVFHRDKSYAVLKQPMSAKQLSETDEFIGLVDNQINNATTNILVHTRAWTTGSPDNNLNNHPIETYSCVGIHNGWLHNDDTLFATKKMTRAAEVDSEAIFRLVDYMGLRLTGEKMKGLAQELSGAFTFAFVRKLFPSHMWIVKQNNPITLTYIEDLNIIIFASMRYFLVNALTEANHYTNVSKYKGINPADLEYVNPTANTIFFFDTSKDTALEQLKQKPISFTETWDTEAWHSVYGFDYMAEGLDPNVYGNLRAVVTDYDATLKRIEVKLLEDEVHALYDLLEAEKAVAHGKGYKEGYEANRVNGDQRESIGFQLGYKRAHRDIEKQQQSAVQV